MTELPALDVRAWMHTQLARVEQALEGWISLSQAPAPHHAPQALVQAMRYSVLDGGKRLRPLLVLAAFDAVCGGGPMQTQARDEGAASHGTSDALALNAGTLEAALRAACSVELIHAYSLVHDDMPCMDNDVLRRGKPTVHVQYGEAVALLAGDALQALAFELLTPTNNAIAPVQQARLCGLLARAAGFEGMAGGQAIDLASVGLHLNEDQLREMHRLKTGALLQASVLMGAACGEPSAKTWAALQGFGAAIGLAFQVVDDVLDVTADSAALGKTAGKDAQNDKPTYVAFMGLEGAKAYAQTLLEQALVALAQSGLADTRLLQDLALRMVRRDN
jgi:farnesyl diphosphate synthase